MPKLSLKTAGYQLPKAAATSPAGQKKLCVIGAGIVGSSMAHTAAEHGYSVSLIAPINSTAPLPAAIVRPTHEAGLSLRQRFYDLAHELAQQQYKSLGMPLQGVRICSIGGENNNRFLTGAGHVYPAACLQELTRHSSIKRIHSRVERLEYHSNGTCGEWRVLDEHTNCCASSPLVVIATGAATRLIDQLGITGTRPARGQLSQFSEPLTEITEPLCFGGQLVNDEQNRPVLGASFIADSHHGLANLAEHEAYLGKLAEHAPEIASKLSQQAWIAWTGTRLVTRDRLPIIGPVPDFAWYQAEYADLHLGRHYLHYPEPKYLPGLYVNIGHGARAFTSAFLAAEILMCQLEDRKSPVDEDLLRALHPARFLLRDMRSAKNKS